MRRRSVVALLAALCLMAVPATASTFLHKPTKELVFEADALIQGRVVEMSSFWTDSGRLIATDVQVAIDDTVFGKASGTVRVRTFGGTVGDITVEAHGFPRFEMGEHVLLYVKADPEDGVFRVHGYQEGQFRVVTRLDGVTLAVPQIDEGARLLTRDGKMAPEPRSIELGQFKNQVKELAARVRDIR